MGPPYFSAEFKKCLQRGPRLAVLLITAGSVCTVPELWEERGKNTINHPGAKDSAQLWRRDNIKELSQCKRLD